MLFKNQYIYAWLDCWETEERDFTVPLALK